MAKLQIFVFVIVAFAQVYGNAVSTFPGIIPQIRPELPITPELRPEVPITPELRPEVPITPELRPEIPSGPGLITPPCVASVRAILEAILERLPEISPPAPLPVEPTDPQVPEPEEEVIPEEPVAPVPETPCSACFQHINNLLTTAEKVLAVRKLMRFR